MDENNIYDLTLEGIIMTHREPGSPEPMDGDETEQLAKLIHIYIDLHEGNITDKEAEEMLGEL
jgi:hypothetical protein